jgi:LPS-assembly protein
MNPVMRAAAAAVAAAFAGFAGPVAAQAQGLKLERSLGAPPDARAGDVPTFLTADRMEGLGGAEFEAVGNAELRRGDTRLTADRIRYEQDADEVEATGNVRLRVAGDEIAGPRLRMRIGDTTGIFDQPNFRFAPRGVDIRGERQRGPSATASSMAEGRAQTVVETRGVAEALRFAGDDQYRLTDGRFTTCKPGQDDWFVESRELDIDMDREVGTARGARLTFMGVSTPRIPWFDFSLTNQRKSGFLPPTVGVQDSTGFDASIPFYWNIAPNYDATLTPRYMSRRGGQLLTQARALQSWGVGEARFEYLPKDRATVEDEKRWALAVGSSMNFQNGLTGLINYQRVSDDNYFRDLSSRVAIATQTFLPQQGVLAYGAPGGWWNTLLNVQRFQTLQDPQNPVAEPYFREPQVLFNASHQTPGGLDVGLAAEYVKFSNRALVPTGQRATAYPYASLPLVTSYGFVVPKIGVSATYYDLDVPGAFAGDPTPSRTLPIASVDSGLFFERDTRWFGTDYMQTLEPRLYYLYVPYENQSDLPVFDTSNSDFNFSQLFQENIFVGGDRIANANQISYAVTSRLVRPSDGQELVRAVAGQQYFFTDQKVFIPGQPVRTQSVSPLILGLSGRVAPDWTVDLGVQYRLIEGPSLDRVITAVRYSPSPASVATVSYRYTAQNLTAGAGNIETVDLAAQWPLGRGFYGVGRVSYDVVGHKTVELLAGVEYNADCWIVRAVAQKFQTGTGTETNAFFIQLELNGLARIGSNPIDVLRRSIPGYTLLNNAQPAMGAADVAPIGGGSSPMDARGLSPLPGGTSAYRYYD